MPTSASARFSIRPRNLRTRIREPISTRNSSPLNLSSERASDPGNACRPPQHVHRRRTPRTRSTRPHAPPSPRAAHLVQLALPSVHIQCTLDRMTTQPLAPMPSAATLSPPAAHPPSPASPGHALPQPAPSLLPAPWSRPRPLTPAFQSPLSLRHSPPQSAPRRPKSFLEKTLTRAKPPHFAPRSPR